MHQPLRFAVVSLLTSLALFLGACGSSGGDPPLYIGPSPCNVLAQTGCGAGQKCTWIQVTDSTGATGCAPTGAKAVSQACTWGVPSSATGYDDCAAGLTCLGASAGVPGECRTDCSYDAGTGCPAVEACMAYAGLFDDTSPRVGLCEATCDPLTQVRLTDGAAACGSPSVLSPTRGCYGYPSHDFRPSTFICATAGSADKTHRVPAANATGAVYLNSCAPGYVPILYDSTGSTTVVCIALCSPVDSYLGNVSQVGGAVPSTCAAAGATGAGEECRFWGFLEDVTTPITPVTNGVGFCLDHLRYTWDADNDVNTLPVPWPSCGDLASTDTNGNGVADYLEWGCGAITSR